MLDLRGALGRWFGGIGAAAPAPTLLVSACAADTLEVEGEDADRAAGFARRFLAAPRHRARWRACACTARCRRTPGSGPGTQLALAVARALAELYGVAADAPALARAVGRAQRSAIGTWTFAGGGLVVEGGRRRERDGVAPLLARLILPADVAVRRRRARLPRRASAAPPKTRRSRGCRRRPSATSSASRISC